MLKTYSKGKKTYKSKREKWRKKGTLPVESENCVQVPNKCVTSLHTTLMLGLPFFSYTKLDLICRNKYCCSKSINLGTKFAGHSCVKSSKGELLHRSVRLERKLIYQVN